MEALSIIIMNEHRRFHLLITTFHSPCTPFADYAHLLINYENTSSDCTNFSIDYAYNSNDCVNIHDDQMNIVVDSTDIPKISFVDFCIPNFALLQLLLFCKSIIKNCVHH